MDERSVPSIPNQKECAESKDSQSKPSQGFHYFIYVGKVEDRADFLGYFGNWNDLKTWLGNNVYRPQAVLPAHLSSSAASFAVWLLEILGAEHFSHAAAFQIISSRFSVYHLKAFAHRGYHWMSNFISLCALLLELD